MARYAIGLSMKICKGTMIGNTLCKDNEKGKTGILPKNTICYGEFFGWVKDALRFQFQFIVASK